MAKSTSKWWKVVVVLLVFGITFMAFVDKEEFDREINLLKRSNYQSQLTFPLDAQTKKIIKDEVAANIVDILWDDVVYWSTFYESADGWTLTGTPTFIGGEVSLSAATTMIVGISKDTNNKNLLKWDKDQRMRMNVSLSSVSDVTAVMIMGNEQIGGSTTSHFGFKITNATLKGIAGDKAASAQTSVDLKTLSASTVYEIDARYYANQKVVFLVDGVELGGISTNLPKTDNDVGYNPGVMEIYVQNDASSGANKQLISSFFEYIRVK